MESTNTESFLKVEQIGTPNNTFNAKISPHTELIPIQYLLAGKELISLNTYNNGSTWMDNYDTVISVLRDSGRSPYVLSLDSHDQKKLRDKMKTLIGHSLIGEIIKVKGYKHAVKGAINDFLSFKTNISPTITGSSIHNSTVDMALAFKESFHRRFTLRTYNGSIGWYSIYEQIMIREESVAKPHILSVILPENLYYQKLHIIKYGNIDLTKVIILVNRELEDSDFHLPGLRTLYMGRLKPLIQATGATIMLVPQSYIEDKCFIPEFKLPISIRERRKAIDELKQTFLNYFATNIIRFPEPIPSPPSEVPNQAVVSVVASSESEGVFATASSDLFLTRMTELRSQLNPSLTQVENTLNTVVVEHEEIPF